MIKQTIARTFSWNVPSSIISSQNGMHSSRKLFHISNCENQRTLSNIFYISSSFNERQSRIIVNPPIGRVVYQPTYLRSETRNLHDTKVPLLVNLHPVLSHIRFVHYDAQKSASVSSKTNKDTGGPDENVKEHDSSKGDSKRDLEKTDTDKIDPNKTDPDQTDLDKSDLDQTYPNKTDPDQTDPNKSLPSKPDLYERFKHSVSMRSRGDVSPEEIARQNDSLLLKAPEKEDIYTRFKQTYKEHGKIMLGVHTLTSFLWYGALYGAVRWGVNVMPLFECVYFCDMASSLIIDKPGSLAYLYYNIATPIRMGSTLVATQVLINYLKKKGVMKQVPSENSFRSMFRDSGTEIKHWSYWEMRKRTRNTVFERFYERDSWFTMFKRRWRKANYSAMAWTIRVKNKWDKAMYHVESMIMRKKNMWGRSVLYMEYRIARTKNKRDQLINYIQYKKNKWDRTVNYMQSWVTRMKTRRDKCVFNVESRIAKIWNTRDRALNYLQYRKNRWDRFLNYLGSCTTRMKTKWDRATFYVQSWKTKK